MILGIATVVVLVLLAVALFPAKKRGGDATSSTNAKLQQSAPLANLREQQVQEEAGAIATEYQRRADEAWLEELNVKASNLLKAPTKTARKQ